MFPYKVTYTDYESDMQNNVLLYKIDHKCQNTFELFEKNGKSRQSKIQMFRNFDFKIISVLWRFVWLAFGGPKFLVYKYVFITYYAIIIVWSRSPVS